MVRFTNNFISTGPPHTSGSTSPIFHFNENGHRSKDIKDLNLNNYILFAGCSHTEGYGLEVEEIYSHHVAGKLNMDYYNMGVGGSGCDVMFYNLMTWLFKYQHKPKLIVLQWPFPMRFCRTYDDLNIKDAIQTEGSWSEGEKASFAISGERIGYFPLRSKLYYNIVKQLNIPVVNVNAGYPLKFLEEYIDFKQVDVARDNMHYGPVTHANLANNIVQYIKNHNLLV